MVRSPEAQNAVRAYLAEPALRPALGTPYGDIAQMILGRLGSDPTDRVMPALKMLRPVDTKLVLFYLIQAVDGATSQARILVDSRRLADEFHQYAESARALLKFCCERTSMRLWQVLPELANELDEAARFYRTKPEELQITDRQNEAARQLLALRHFSFCLRDKLQLKCASAKQKKAVQWLVEIALDVSIPDGRVAEGLLRPRSRTRKNIDDVGQTRPQKHHGCPKSPNIMTNNKKYLPRRNVI
jgi:hypothetical protein